MLQMEKRKKKETTQCRSSSNDGFLKMKQNKSSEVIPLRPHTSDAKKTERTEQTVYCLAQKDHIHHVIFNLPLKLVSHCDCLSNHNDW